MTEGETCWLAENNIPCPNSAPAAIRVNALYGMYREDAFDSQGLSYCFDMNIKQEDTQLVKIQDMAGLHGWVKILAVMALV